MRKMDTNSKEYEKKSKIENKRVFKSIQKKIQLNLAEEIQKNTCINEKE